MSYLYLMSFSCLRYALSLLKQGRKMGPNHPANYPKSTNNFCGLVGIFYESVGKTQNAKEANMNGKIEQRVGHKKEMRLHPIPGRERGQAQDA